MKINIRETTMVKPSKPTPLKILWNSNLDLIVGRIHLLTVYFYKPINNNGILSKNNFFDSRIMKEALSNVLVSFYPMAGRLAKNKEGRIEINCNGEGVLFVEAQSDDTFIDDFGDFVPSLEMKNKLIPNVDTSGEITSFPLVIFQVTRFKCGGVSLGCGIFHTLSDGISSIHFINTWSEIARGLSVAVPPFIDRTLLRARDPPTPAFKHVEYHHPLTLKNVHDQVNSPKSSTTAMFKITSDQLTLLRTRSEHEGSTYEVLAAHIWRCTCKARGLDDDQLTKLHVATNGRTRLFPPLPQGYLGNVVFTATPIAKSSELQSEPLTKTARRIHDALARMNDEYLRSAIDYLELMTDLSKLIRGPTYFASPNLNINSWTKLPVHDSDFGWGKPIHMGPACILYEGTVYILSSPNDDKNLRLAVCLDADHMPLFGKYLYDF
ncbi:shikimate O-hydroxycinnamoyltransferase-like [Lycium ferocissimum]|uniref:shikimate O-hydroxycinnamoyltransferase-like n=1 Tax=Lycium ferocissimum TaxID=112874 RepID=UPI0028151DA7|nr:shikimate O-hydroxycinnamoyltransferase-like [Lycium ferocissimum]